MTVLQADIITTKELLQNSKYTFCSHDAHSHLTLQGTSEQ